jgi:hypothetical protein
MASYTENLLPSWLWRLRESQFSHYDAAKALDRCNYWLGVPVILLSTFVGTSVFAALGKSVDPPLQIFVGLVSVVAAMLSGVQTVLRFSERAEKHRSVAVRYGALRREIEEILATGGQIPKEPTGGQIPKERLTDLREKIDKLGDESPHIPSRIWSHTKKTIGESRFIESLH